MEKTLLQKIRKCLALGQSDNEHEAAAALAKARALMDEHGITDEQLAMAEIEEATARSNRTQRPPRWEITLTVTVCQAMGVTSFLDEKGDRTFVGRGATAEIAGYAFEVLFRKLKMARADYIKARLKRCKPGRKRQRADIFCEAWATAVYLKVKALVPERPKDDDLETYVTKLHPGLVKVDERKAKLKGGGVNGDIQHGAIAGSDVELNAGVGGGEEPRLALT